MKRVLALTAIEAPFRSTLITTQLLRPLSLARQCDPKIEIVYLALVPWTFWFSLRRPWCSFAANGRRLRQLRNELREGGVAIHVWPILWPLLPRQFNLTAWQRILYRIGAAPAMVLYMLAHRRPDVIISRSFPATLMAGIARKLFGTPYVFDLRGMYPEECVNAGAFGPGTRDYHGWKQIERALIAGAARCVVVSEPFAEHVRSILPDADPVVIPCCVDPGSYRYDQAEREQAKARYGLAGRFVLLHLGSFGTPGDRGLAGKYLLRFKRAETSAILVIASGTPAYGAAIRAALLGEGLTPEDFMIIHPAAGGVSNVLAVGDAGLLLERKAPNTKACLSVKLGEYLASGLPVICTPHVEGAARLVDRYRCGLIIDPDADEPLEKEKQFLGALPQLRENGFKLVKDVLAIDVCAAVWSGTIERALPQKEKH